jgi:hypothetical protein
MTEKTLEELTREVQELRERLDALETWRDTFWNAVKAGLGAVLGMMKKENPPKPPKKRIFRP